MVTNNDIVDIHPLRTYGPKDRTGAERQRRYRDKQKAAVTPAVTSAVTAPIVTIPEASHPVTMTVGARDVTAGIDMAAYLAAFSLAGVAAMFSVRGMAVLFPGAPAAVVTMAVTLEAAKLVTTGWLASRWSVTPWAARLALIGFILGLAIINATGVYAQLVAAHVGSRGEAEAAVETKDAEISAKIDVQTQVVADLDRRLGQIDSAIEEAAKRGKTATALSAIEGQRRARAALADERNREAGTLAALKTERAQVAAKGRQAETEAAPIRYVAELVGADADSERAIRWLILLMVLCCDPLAIALTASASAGRKGA
jgi:hypothetical protein